MLSFLLTVRWLIMLVMDDGDEEDAVVPNNLLKGLDELPSWRDGFRLILAPRIEFSSS